MHRNEYYKKVTKTCHYRPATERIGVEATIQNNKKHTTGKNACVYDKIVLRTHKVILKLPRIMILNITYRCELKNDTCPQISAW